MFSFSGRGAYSFYGSSEIDRGAQRRQEERRAQQDRGAQIRATSSPQGQIPLSTVRTLQPANTPSHCGFVAAGESPCSLLMTREEEATSDLSSRDSSSSFSSPPAARQESTKPSFLTLPASEARNFVSTVSQ